MKRVEEIKEKRQAHYIRERQRKARAIERMKDVKEVQRDLALIKSPAVGMKRAAKEMEVDDNEEEEEQGLDTSLNIKALKATPARRSARQKVAKIVTEVEADQEMEENWTLCILLSLYNKGYTATTNYAKKSGKIILSVNVFSKFKNNALKLSYFALKLA